MVSRIRDALYRAITSSRGDSLAPVRLSRDLVRRFNATLGRPLAPTAELGMRKEARARLIALRREGIGPRRKAVECAPVLLYFETDRNARALTRIEELLSSKGLAWTRLDVAGDEATIEFVTRKANCDRDDLPIVFVAERAIGGYEALVRADVSGELARLVDPS